MNYMRKQRKIKSGSVLVFTLIVLSIVILAGLGITQTTLTNRKIGITSTKGNAAFQISNTAVENILMEIKDNGNNTIVKLKAVSGLSCPDNDGVIKNTTVGYTATFKNSTGTPITTCDSAESIATVKVVGQSGDSARAVEVVVPSYPIVIDEGEIIGQVSMTINPDNGGLPVIAYTKKTGGQDDIWVLTCDRGDCLGINKLNKIVSGINGNNALSPNSLAIDFSGHPVITYYESSTVKVFHCDDMICDSGSSNDIAAGSVYFAIKKGSSGNPIVAYSTQSYGPAKAIVKIAYCSDERCSTSPMIYDGNTLNGDMLRSIYLGVMKDGEVIVGYNYGDGYNLKITICDVMNCSSPKNRSINSKEDANGSIGVNNIQGFAKIGYITGTDQGLHLSSCSAGDCPNPIEDNTIVATPWAIGLGTPFSKVATVVDSSGIPYVSYSYKAVYGGSDFGLNLVKCPNGSCSGVTNADIFSVDTAAGKNYQQKSMAIGSDSCPIIAYIEINNQDLKFVHYCVH